MGFWNYLFGISDDGQKRTGNADLPENKDTLGYMEYKEEYSMEPHVEEQAADVISYSDSGVQLKEAQNGLRLVYDGTLARQGAQEVYAVIGYGNNLKWEDTAEYAMQKTGDQTFELTFPIHRNGNINAAFKDSAGNWDNNSGWNYTFSDQSEKGSH